MEISRRTWIAALRLAVVVSVLAALVAVAATMIGDVPTAAIVVPVIVIAFSLSWVQTGRLQRTTEVVPSRRRWTAPIA